MHSSQVAENVWSQDDCNGDESASATPLLSTFFCASALIPKEPLYDAANHGKKNSLKAKQKPSLQSSRRSREWRLYEVAMHVLWVS